MDLFRTWWEEIWQGLYVDTAFLLSVSMAGSGSDVRAQSTGSLILRATCSSTQAESRVVRHRTVERKQLDKNFLKKL